MQHPIIAPSVLSADFGNLQRDVEMINHSQADWIHVDIMDGVFVPNISIGFPVVKAIKKHAIKPLDVHLMITQPERFIMEFKNAGADILSVHIEACHHLHRTIFAIKEAGMKAGVALNPHTPVSILSEVIGEIDMVCLMGVNPGFGGQKFIENTYEKCAELKNLIIAKKSNCLIEIDGGVNDVTSGKLLKFGADVLVAGNYVFSAKDPKAIISSLKKLYAHTADA